MLLSCPNCQTEYDVPDAALTGRSRKLRCANCMTSWKVPALDMYRQDPQPEAHEVPAEIDPPVLEDAGTTEVTAEDTEIAAAPEQKATPERMSIWKASRDLPPAIEPTPSPKRGLGKSILIVALIIVLVLLAHRPISHIWPPSLRLFNALGLHS